MEFLNSVQFTFTSNFISLNTLSCFHTIFISQTRFNFIWGTFLLFIWVLIHVQNFVIQVIWTCLPIMNTSNVNKGSLIKMYSYHFTRTNLQKDFLISLPFSKIHASECLINRHKFQLNWGMRGLLAKMALCPNNMKCVTLILAEVLILCWFNRFPDFL